MATVRQPRPLSNTARAACVASIELTTEAQQALQQALRVHETEPVRTSAYITTALWKLECSNRQLEHIQGHAKSQIATHDLAPKEKD